MAACCGRNAKYPGASAMARNLAGTVLMAMRHAISEGAVLAHEDVVRSRIGICDLCDRKSGTRCKECGCFITLKTAILVAECPLHKWPKNSP